MNTTMAKILSAENEYSTEPKAFTLTALTATSAAENPTIQHHPGTLGTVSYTHLDVYKRQSEKH